MKTRPGTVELVAALCMKDETTIWVRAEMKGRRTVGGCIEVLQAKIECRIVMVQQSQMSLFVARRRDKEVEQF